MKKTNNFQRECESTVRKLVKELKSKGILVRRENLTRGPSYRVRSGKCELTGHKILFLDRRLPVEQQLQMIESHYSENL